MSTSAACDSVENGRWTRWWLVEYIEAPRELREDTLFFFGSVWNNYSPLPRSLLTC